MYANKRVHAKLMLQTQQKDYLPQDVQLAERIEGWPELALEGIELWSLNQQGYFAKQGICYAVGHDLVDQMYDELQNFGSQEVGQPQNLMP